MWIRCLQSLIFQVKDHTPTRLLILSSSMINCISRTCSCHCDVSTVIISITGALVVIACYKIRPTSLLAPIAMHCISTNQWKQAVLPPSLIVFIQGRFILCTAFCIGLWMSLKKCVHHTGTRIKVLPLPITWIAPSPTSEQSAVQIKHLRDDHGYKFKEGTEKRGHHKWLSHSIGSKVQLFACPEWMSDKQLIRWFVRCPCPLVETRLRDALIFLQASKLV